jgi:ribonucleoside-diphosphate reductase beta chain
LDENFKTGTLQNDQLFLEALVNNILLEGVFFYSSFLMFYALARNNKMLNSARMIGLINRDEATHCGLITLIVNSLVQERPDLWTLEFQSKIIDMVKQATELEVAWGQEIISDGILGVTPEGVEAYVKSLARLRLKGLGLPEVYTAENPYDWIDQYTQINQELGAFFETSVSRYSQETPKFDEASLEW